MKTAAKSRLVVAALGASVVVGAVTFLASDPETPTSSVHETKAPGTPASSGTATASVRDLPVWLQKATLEPGSEPTPLRAARPSSGEGSPRAQLPPEEKADAAVASVESAIDEIRLAETDEKRDEIREQAAARLSGVRAEMWATDEGRELYLELQTELEDA